MTKVSESPKNHNSFKRDLFSKKKTQKIDGVPIIQATERQTGYVVHKTIYKKVPYLTQFMCVGGLARHVTDRTDRQDTIRQDSFS
jgi:hypothetical protein